MKKILGVLAICFISLFMLASCVTESKVTSSTEVASDSGTIIFELDTVAKEDRKTHVFRREGEDDLVVEYVYIIKLYLMLDLNKDPFYVYATKLIQYDTYFTIEGWNMYGRWGSESCDNNKWQYTIE